MFALGCLPSLYLWHGTPLRGYHVRERIFTPSAIVSATDCHDGSKDGDDDDNDHGHDFDHDHDNTADNNDVDDDDDDDDDNGDDLDYDDRG